MSTFNTHNSNAHNSNPFPIHPPAETNEPLPPPPYSESAPYAGPSLSRSSLAPRTPRLPMDIERRQWDTLEEYERRTAQHLLAQQDFSFPSVHTGMSPEPRVQMIASRPRRRDPVSEPQTAPPPPRILPSHQHFSPPSIHTGMSPEPRIPMIASRPRRCAPVPEQQPAPPPPRILPLDRGLFSSPEQLSRSLPRSVFSERRVDDPVNDFIAREPTPLSLGAPALPDGVMICQRCGLQHPPRYGQPDPRSSPRRYPRRPKPALLQAALQSQKYRPASSPQFSQSETRYNDGFAHRALLSFQQLSSPYQSAHRRSQRDSVPRAHDHAIAGNPSEPSQTSNLWTAEQRATWSVDQPRVQTERRLKAVDRMREKETQETQRKTTDAENETPRRKTTARPLLLPRPGIGGAIVERTTVGTVAQRRLRLDFGDDAIPYSMEGNAERGREVLNPFCDYDWEVLKAEVEELDRIRDEVGREFRRHHLRMQRALNEDWDV